MPTPHEFLAKLGIASVELLDRQCRNAAYERALHSDSGMLVRLIDQSLQSCGTALPEQADDPLVSVRQVLNELDKAAPHREHRPRRIPDMIEDGPQLELQLFDGQIKSLEVRFLKIGKQREMSNAALLACGSTSPRS